MPNTTPPVEELPPTAEQAKRIVQTWRCTDQRDELLVFYIAQALDDNIELASRRQGEVAGAMVELKEMFAPDGVQIQHDVWERGNSGKCEQYTIITDDVTRPKFEGATLAEAMQKVRDWKGSQKK